MRSLIRQAGETQNLAEASDTVSHSIFGEAAERLREARRAAGITQKELAERMGVTRETISRYESGSHPIPLQSMAALSVAVDGFEFVDLVRDEIGGFATRSVAHKLLEIQSELLLMRDRCDMLASTAQIALDILKAGTRVALSPEAATIEEELADMRHKPK